MSRLPPAQCPGSAPAARRHRAPDRLRPVLVHHPRTVVTRRAKCRVLKAVRKVRRWVRLFWVVVELARLFAAVAVLKLKRAYEERAGDTIYDYRWPTIDVAQKELFHGPKSGLNIVTWSRVCRKPQSLQGIKWRLLVDLRLLTTCRVRNHEYGKTGELTREVWFQKRLKKLFQAHVGGRLLAEYQETAPDVYLGDKSSRRAAEILAQHEGVTRRRFKTAVHYMELRAKRRAKHRLTRE